MHVMAVLWDCWNVQRCLFSCWIPILWHSRRSIIITCKQITEFSPLWPFLSCDDFFYFNHNFISFWSWHLCSGSSWSEEALKFILTPFRPRKCISVPEDSVISCDLPQAPKPSGDHPSSLQTYPGNFNAQLIGRFYKLRPFYLPR